MSDVLKLEKPIVNRKTVEILEAVLADAKAGMINEIFIVQLDKSGDFYHRTSGFDERMKLLGYLTFTIHKINHL